MKTTIGQPGEPVRWECTCRVPPVLLGTITPDGCVNIKARDRYWHVLASAGEIRAVCPRCGSEHTLELPADPDAASTSPATPALACQDHACEAVPVNRYGEPLQLVIAAYTRTGRRQRRRTIGLERRPDGTLQRLAAPGRAIEAVDPDSPLGAQVAAALDAVRSILDELAVRRRADAQPEAA